MTKYIAHYKDSVQISPDDFKVFTQMLECDENTTLKEAMDWVQSHYRKGRTFTVTQPEKLNEKEDKPF